jgi:hypothetical protein
MIRNSNPAKGFHSSGQSYACRYGAGSRNRMDVGLTFVSDVFVLAPSLGKQGGAPVACKLTGKAHSEFEKWLLAGDEN